MSVTSKRVLLIVALLAAAGLAAVFLQLRHGVSARDRPSALEEVLARRLRHLAIPRTARQAPNPVAPSPEALDEARAHFADHCATCHGNDGRGQTEIGQNLYPKAPDMTRPETQSLSDGELFFIIHNGIRLTGMPAWGGGPPEKDLDSWKLVHFIRHLPQATPQELEAMKAMNPRSPGEAAEEEEIQKFLEGKDDASPAPHSHSHRH